MISATQSKHLSQYAETDFERHFTTIDEGLSEDELALFSRLDPNLATLEVGCSSGRISFGLERQLGFSNLSAIDIVPRFIEAARTNAENRSSRVGFEVADITRIRNGDETLDQVVCWGVVLSHLIERKQPTDALSEMFRVLKPGGRLVINALNSRRRDYMGLVRLFVRLIRAFHNPHGYGPQVRPRLGLHGRPDPFFWRADKAQVYLYEAGEFISDILDAGFVVEVFRTSEQAMQDGFGPTGTNRTGGYALYAMAQKLAIPITGPAENRP